MFYNPLCYCSLNWFPCRHSLYIPGDYYLSDRKIHSYTHYTANQQSCSEEKLNNNDNKRDQVIRVQRKSVSKPAQKETHLTRALTGWLITHFTQTTSTITGTIWTTLTGEILIAIYTLWTLISLHSWLTAVKHKQKYVKKGHFILSQQSSWPSSWASYTKRSFHILVCPSSSFFYKLSLVLICFFLFVWMVNKCQLKVLTGFPDCIV